MLIAFSCVDGQRFSPASVRMHSFQSALLELPHLGHVCFLHHGPDGSCAARKGCEEDEEDEKDEGEGGEIPEEEGGQY